MTNQCVNHTGINRTRVHISKGLKILTHILPYFAIVVHCFPLSVVTQLSLYCNTVTGCEKPREACLRVEQEGISFREAERMVESDLFVDEYPKWDLGTPH